MQLTDFKGIMNTATHSITHPEKFESRPVRHIFSFKIIHIVFPLLRRAGL